MNPAGFSLAPDPWMQWIYDSRDPRFTSEEAYDLRERRAAALRNAPRWMVEHAEMNDALRKDCHVRSGAC
jgi:hypothetical protein